MPDTVRTARSLPPPGSRRNGRDTAQADCSLMSMMDPSLDCLGIWMLQLYIGFGARIFKQRVCKDLAFFASPCSPYQGLGARAFACQQAWRPWGLAMLPAPSWPKKLQQWG